MGTPKAGTQGGQIQVGHESISVEPLKRNVQTVTIYVHELLNIKNDIKKGIPINWGLRLFWSIFCLCVGKVISDALTQTNFELIAYILSLNAFISATLAISLLGSLLLLFLAKAQGSAVDGIEQILEQCGYESKRSSS